MLELNWPWFLLILPLPLFMYFLPSKNQQQSSIWWPSAKLLAQHQETTQLNPKFNISLLLLALAWIALVFAIARPSWLGEPTQVTPSGRDLLIALDLSGSMQVTDMSLNGESADRLSAAKSVLADFIQRRRGDRVGIIVFGSKAYLQAPLSFDTTTINQLVQETQIGFAGEKTAIGDAIGLGIKQLENKPSDQKVLILMTDGANTAGRVQPQQAANFAHSQQVKIHTIGIGADQMQVQGFFGPKSINPSADLDEALLQNIAQQTGGEYFRARSTADLQSIYNILDHLEPTPSEDLWQRPKTDFFHYLAMLALIFFALALASSKQFQWRLKVRS